MYALCEYTYDYYEWENVVAVSKSHVSLINHYKEQKSNYELHTPDEHEEISTLHNLHRTHWAIREIKYLDGNE
tara:strand:- start:247 stop:465 length:219 start_codon:yes stop_codon:yes gene_type:complete